MRVFSEPRAMECARPQHLLVLGTFTDWGKRKLCGDRSQWSWEGDGVHGLMGGSRLLGL